MPAAVEAALDPVARIIRLAVSAAKADGTLSDQERAVILEHAREAGLESIVEAELAQTRPLADIVRGVTDPAIRKDLYVLAFAIVRADETVSGAERIYLAQLAHQLGLDPAAVQAIESRDGDRRSTHSGELSLLARWPDKEQNGRLEPVVHGHRWPSGRTGQPAGDHHQPAERQHRRGDARVHAPA